LRRATHVLAVLRRHALLNPRRRPEPAQVRAALEELGPVFQKFGQVLALRRDMLPDAYVRELEALHDRVPPLPYESVRTILENELGQEIEAAFASFNTEPLAAATIAQVHAARLSDGREVVVKVRRPDLEAAIDRDTAVLGYVAWLADTLVPPLRPLDLPALVIEFRETLRREADFRIEARSIRRFREKLSGVRQVWIPDVIEERTTEGVLTMEHSPGVRIDAYAREHPEEGRGLAAAVAALVLRQIFEDGLFHADPHPGNLFVLPDGRLCLHDFGMVGELSESMRVGLGDLLAAEVRGDAEAAAAAYLRLGLPGGDTDRDGLKHEFERLLDQMHGRPLREISLGEEMQKLLRVGGSNRMRNPRELLLLARAFLIAEALLRRLDPDINVVEVFQAELGRLEVRRVAPERLAKDATQLFRTLGRASLDLPAGLEGVLRRVASGDLGRVRDEAVATELRAVRGLLRAGIMAVAGGAGLLAGTALLLAGAGAVQLVGYVVAAAGVAALGHATLRRPRD
jgi:ubiquinone biosynthesis protein